MAQERTYSTREIAQMWNVSESTVKRWADTAQLGCTKTVGGHRRFRLEDIRAFQESHGFEATGLLEGFEWEDPELEVWLNTKDFVRVRRLLTYLASHNQRLKVRTLLERVYLRGIRLAEIYDSILAPIEKDRLAASPDSELSPGQHLLVRQNLEDAIGWIMPHVFHRKSNGKTGLCAGIGEYSRFGVNAVSRVLEAEGWDALNLGAKVLIPSVTEMVRLEPVSLVCLACHETDILASNSAAFDDLLSLAAGYSIPVVLTDTGLAHSGAALKTVHPVYASNLRELRRLVAGLST